MSVSKAALSVMFLLGSAQVVALPLPPPPPDRAALEKRFFEALPKRLPVDDLDAFAPFVSKDLKVYIAGKLAFSDRNEWFAFLQSHRGTRPDGPRGITISREQFYATRDGEIIVLEFRWPIPPAGKEGQISYHQDYDLQLVSYQLDQGILKRLDYGKGLRTYDWLKDNERGVPRLR